MNEARLSYQKLWRVSQTIQEMKRIASQYRHDMDRYFGLCPRKFFYVAKQVLYVDDDMVVQRYVQAGLIPSDADGYEFVQRPAFTLQSGGDCDDKATMAAAYMYLQAIPWHFVTIGNEPNEWNHVYLYIKYSGQWLPYDVTATGVDIFQDPPGTIKAPGYFKDWGGWH